MRLPARTLSQQLVAQGNVPHRIFKISQIGACSRPEQMCACAVQAARGARRRRAQEEAAPASKLSPGCDALVRLAEPGDVYAHYNTAMSAAAVSTQIKAMEQRLGLKVRMACPHRLQGCTMHLRASFCAQRRSGSL